MSFLKSLKETAVGAIVGAGMQGRIVAEIWRRAGAPQELLFLDDDSAHWGTVVADIPVVGPLDSLDEFDRTDVSVLVALGNNFTRTRIAARLGKHEIRFATAIDPSAVVASDAVVAPGSVVGPQAVIHTGAEVGEQVVVNAGAVVEHDSVLESGVTLAPGVTTAGRVYVERHAFVAAGATIVGRVRIGRAAIVGAGAVVTRDVPPETLVYGCPARVIRKVTEEDWLRLF
jgi:sugar O-acyltransferase (sialic acid O-acetyltransferase NeuD family)